MKFIFSLLLIAPFSGFTQNEDTLLISSIENYDANGILVTEQRFSYNQKGAKIDYVRINIARKDTNIQSYLYNDRGNLEFIVNSYNNRIDTTFYSYKGDTTIITSENRVDDHIQTRHRYTSKLDKNGWLFYYSQEYFIWDSVLQYHTIDSTFRSPDGWPDSTITYQMVEPYLTQEVHIKTSINGEQKEKPRAFKVGEILSITYKLRNKENQLTGEVKKFIGRYSSQDQQFIKKTTYDQFGRILTFTQYWASDTVLHQTLFRYDTINEIIHRKSLNTQFSDYSILTYHLNSDENHFIESSQFKPNGEPINRSVASYNKHGYISELKYYWLFNSKPVNSPEYPSYEQTVYQYREFHKRDMK